MPDCFPWSVIIPLPYIHNWYLKKYNATSQPPLPSRAPSSARNFSSVPRFVTVDVPLVLYACNWNLSFRSSIQYILQVTGSNTFSVHYLHVNYSVYVTQCLLFMSWIIVWNISACAEKILKQLTYWIVLCILEQKFGVDMR